MLLDWLAIVQNNHVAFILGVRNEVTLAPLSGTESLHILRAMHGICFLLCFVGDDCLPMSLRNNYLMSARNVVTLKYADTLITGSRATTKFKSNV